MCPIQNEDYSINNDVEVKVDIEKLAQCQIERGEISGWEKKYQRMCQY